MNKAIICVNAHVENWGAERSTCSLCNYLQQKGQKVVVLLPRKGKITNLLNEINVEYIIHPFRLRICNKDKFIRPDIYIRRFFSEEMAVHSIARIFKKRNIHPVLIYSSTITFSAGIRLAQIFNIPHVQHIRENIDAFNYKFLYGYKFTMWHINKNSDCIICTCNAVKNRYIKELDEKKTFAIYNGIPPIEDVPSKDYNGILRLIQVARYMPDKRICDTLQAICELKKRGISNIQLDIYGSGMEENKYISIIKKHNLENSVKLMGFIPKIDFSPYHIGIMSSTFEAFARSTLDYMNNGLAVIASNTGGNLEQVVDGETGLLYRVHSSDDMADKIEALYNKRTDIKMMGQYGRKHFLKNFTQEKYTYNVGQKILALIEDK